MQHRPRLSLNVPPSTWAQEANASSSLKFAPLNPESPTTAIPRTPMHVRRKTYAGDLTSVSRDVIREYEGRIALLESQNDRISVELERARDALSDEQEERKIERHSLILTSSPPPVVPPPTELDGHINEQSELLYERRLRVEILETLKKIRAQNTSLSRELREQKDKSASLTGILDAEKEEKEQMREEITRLSQKNFTLFEHNKLLVGRDSILQEEIANLMTKSQADDWMRNVLETELRKARHDSPNTSTFQLSPNQPTTIPTITLEQQGPLRHQLVAAQDELHITQIRLQTSEKKCKELEERVLGLQQNMTRCLDSSSKALEVERGLRAELAEHAANLENQNASLKHDLESAMFDLETSRQCCISVQDETVSVDHLQTLADENEQLKHQADSMNLQLEQLRRRKRADGRAGALVLENEQLKSRVTTLEMELDKLRCNRDKPQVVTGLKPLKLNQQAVCGVVQKVTVGVWNVSTLHVIPEDTALIDEDVNVKILRRERLLDRQLRAAASKRLCQHHRKRERRHVRPALSSPYIRDDTTNTLSSTPQTIIASSPHMSVPPDSSKTSPLPSARYNNSPRIYPQKRPADTIPTPIDTTCSSSHPSSPLPPMYDSLSPSTPQKPAPRVPHPTPIGEFPSDVPFSIYAPDSPDSTGTASTLVSAVTPETKLHHRKSVMLVSALSSKKSHSFDYSLKSVSTLSVTTEIDINNEKPRKKVRFKKPHRTSAKEPAKESSTPKMRRASAALTDIVRSYSGFENLEDWLIV
ncbi:hypothetical protein VKT23_004225 [Stygiomarasmius scandens]|uniref:Uncharacterized protein n=1 Tax=Marasmiellus scandens TaxID=2682957 RepID=A0ABR1JW11_9AGAR